ncbi:MAG: polysaccharide biosynthesis/export family protein [Planctomycetota bacterium]|jgi:protein involved in polysaccharide export with SLBB domain
MRFHCAGKRRYILPTAAIIGLRRRLWGVWLLLFLAPAWTMNTGCMSILNGWLDPTTVGNFQEISTLEIRTSLSLEDAPSGIPGAVFPTRDDLIMKALDYPIHGGDILDIEVHELRERFMPYRDPEVRVSATGFINLPVLGRVRAAGMTVPDFERELSQTLIDKEILLTPEVTVNPNFLQNETYSIFGIGVSAANNAPLRAGTFPIRRPDLRLLEAINQVGGLNEFVSDVFIFRTDDPNKPAFMPGDSPAGDRESEMRETGAGEQDVDDGGEAGDQAPGSPASDPRSDLINAVEGGGDDRQQEPDTLPNELFEPDPTEPWIYVNGEFVRNTAYDESTIDHSRQALVLDGPTPTVNWSRIAGEANFRVLQIPADQLRDGNPEANIYIRPGDVIRVVSGEIGVYYVMGQVNRVGPFRFDAEPVTLKAAIAAAGGLSSLAWPDRCTVYRRLGRREQMIQVNLDRIFGGKDPDFMIHRGDIINVGTHPFAPFLQRIRAATLPTISNVIGYGFTYSRNFADIDSYEPKRNPDNELDLLPQLFR